MTLLPTSTTIIYGQTAAENQEAECWKGTVKVVLSSVIQPVIHESLLVHAWLYNGPWNNYNMPQAHTCSHTLSGIVYQYMVRHSQQMAPSLAVQASLKCLLLSSSEFTQDLLFYSNIRYPSSQLPVMPILSCTSHFPCLSHCLWLAVQICFCNEL